MGSPDTSDTLSTGSGESSLSLKTWEPWEDIARRELCEDITKTPKRVSRFRKRVRKLESKTFKPNLEESFLAAFLRANMFDEDKAFDSYRRFFRLRTIEPETYYPFNRGSLSYKDVLDHNLAFVLSKKNPLDGTTLIVVTFQYLALTRFRDFKQLYTPTALQILMLLRSPEIQVRGFRFIADLKCFSLGYLRHVPISLAKVCGESSSGAMPIRLLGIHLVNEPSWYQLLLKMVTPFLDSEDSITQVHGSDLSSLHRIVHPSALPKELGGRTGSILADNSIRTEFFRRNNDVQYDSTLGHIPPRKSERHLPSQQKRNVKRRSKDGSKG